jgi:hypothetical protein
MTGVTVSGGYQIDLPAVGKLITTVQGAARNITNANNGLKDMSLQDLGSHMLDDAAGDFSSRWEYGTGKISQLAGTISQGLQQTVQTYQAVEDALAQSLQDIEKNLPPPAPVNSGLATGGWGPASTAPPAHSRIDTALSGDAS